MAPNYDDPDFMSGDDAALEKALEADARGKSQRKAEHPDEVLSDKPALLTPEQGEGVFWRRDDRAVHPIAIWALEEQCGKCGRPASHKIGEEGTSSFLHNLTAYVCCRCFQSVVGDCTSHPYPEPIE